SAGGYKGYGLGLMVEVLAAGLTGSRLSVDVPPLKSPEGPPHDLGQFYVVIDPSGYSGDGFTERLTTLAATIAEQPGARLPGAGREAPDNVDLEPGLWEATQALAGD
ncbi:MAG TPA: lactate dehydrogenase, partial [Acidimicrobiaceae bacterium]|nr:lactate dehydrogenase [Acidimicrobiaceae bacterium]